MRSCSKTFQFLRTTVAAVAVISGASIAFAQPAMCPVQPGTTSLLPPIRQTVVITDPAVIAAGNFSFARTLNSIIETSGGSTAPATEAERTALLQSMLNTFNQSGFVNPDSNLTLPVDLRPNEAGLSPAELLSGTGPHGMRPVGLFNRLDLAPSDLSHCGEHRIVYAKGTGGDILNRFLIIFEAALDNPVDDPDPVKRRAGCRAVAAFWDGLKDLSGSDLATKLADFYYKGLPASGAIPAFRPVVHFQHFGTPFGQVRGNLFVTPPVVWQLREWRVVTSPDARAAFTPVTVKNNPIAELYGPKKASDVFDGLKDPFKAIFIDKNEAGQEQLGTLLEQLTVFDRAMAANQPVDGAPARKEEVSARVGMLVHNRFNDFQSVSHDDRDDPAGFASQTDMAQRINAKLKELKLADQCQITAEHIINRAGAVSCGGCHQFSVGKPIAPGVVWPSAEGRFVHISEGGKLSPALEFEFLPVRRRVVENALKAPAAPTPTPPVVTPTPTPPQVYVRSLSRAANDSKGQRSDFYDAAAKLERQIRADRAKEQALPGAYVPIRRTH